MPEESGIERIVNRVTGQGKTENKGVGRTVVHVVKVLPVLEIIPVVGQLGGEGEVIVGPVQALSESNGNSDHLKHLVRVVCVLDGVLIVVVIVVGTVAVAVTVASVEVGNDTEYI